MVANEIIIIWIFSVEKSNKEAVNITLLRLLFQD